MKWRRWLALAAALVLIGCSFLPWVYIESANLTLPGTDDLGLNYGPRGRGHIYFAVMCIIMILIGRNWSMLFAIVVAMVNLAFAGSHLYVYRCTAGICPEKLYGLYLTIGASLLMLAGLLYSPVNPDKAEK
jgi:hypothetical protein